MLKELKQKREQKRDDLSKKVYLWKEDLGEQYRKYFPKPKMEKSTNYLLEDNQEALNAESTKTTRLILKFWLIGLAIVAL